MSDTQIDKMIKATELPQVTFIKGGEIQVLNTSGTTTVTQEMANVVFPRTTSVEQQKPIQRDPNK